MTPVPTVRTAPLPPPTIPGFRPVFAYAPTVEGMSSNTFIVVGVSDLSAGGTGMLERFKELHARSLPLPYGDEFFARAAAPPPDMLVLTAWAYVANGDESIGKVTSRGMCMMVGFCTACWRPRQRLPPVGAGGVWGTVTGWLSSAWTWVWGADDPPPVAGEGADGVPGERELYVMTLGVQPEARRCGIGRTLLFTTAALGVLPLAQPAAHDSDSSVVVDAAALGPSPPAPLPLPPTVMALDCMAENRLGQALYRSVGMAVTAQLPSHYVVFGEWHDGVRMETPLPLAGNYVAAALSGTVTDGAGAEVGATGAAPCTPAPSAAPTTDAPRPLAGDSSGGGVEGGGAGADGDGGQ